MSYPINYPTPQGANIQIFELGGSVSDWVKPQGASFVWFTLIGSGGAGSTGTGLGGGSGAVTNFMAPAFLMPDVLRITVGRGGQADANSGSDSRVVYQQKNSSGYTLLAATGGSSVGGSTMTANAFAAMGFFQSTAGVEGNSSITAAQTTFLTGGGTAGSGVTNYGYTTPGGTGTGFFQTQPIIVGLGGTGVDKDGGVGCGGGGTVVGFGKGGDGMVVIITW